MLQINKDSSQEQIQEKNINNNEDEDEEVNEGKLIQKPLRKLKKFPTKKINKDPNNIVPFKFGTGDGA